MRWSLFALWLRFGKLHVCVAPQAGGGSGTSTWQIVSMPRRGVVCISIIILLGMLSARSRR